MLGDDQYIAAESAEDRIVRTEQRLFQMVVAQAVAEALGHAPDGSRTLLDARQWILADADFERVCDLAGWDAATIRRQTRQFIEGGKRSRLLEGASQQIRRRHAVD